jgi:hypothetical protein
MTIFKPLPAVGLLVALGATPAGKDPMAALNFLVGNWTCTFHQGPVRVTYKATYAYDLGGNWMRERDSWTGGGGDEGSITFDPKHREWLEVVLEQEHAATLFHAAYSGPAHIVYKGLYPDTNLTDVFDRISPTRYTLHFSGKLNGKYIKSYDTCVKQ